MPYSDPTFNDDAIFGVAVIMLHDDPANAAQTNHYPGVTGSERLDLGMEMTATMVTGHMTGDEPSDVGAAFQVIRELKESATLGTLVDTEGNEWENSYIEWFREKGRLVFAPLWGWVREYEMKIGHLGADAGGDDGSGDGGTDGGSSGDSGAPTS